MLFLRSSSTRNLSPSCVKPVYALLCVGMATNVALQETPEPWIPEDSFGSRLALVRAHKRWNVKKAAEACDVDPSSWTNWERGLTHPQDYEVVTRKIADGSGCHL